MRNHTVVNTGLEISREKSNQVLVLPFYLLFYSMAYL